VDELQFAVREEVRANGVLELDRHVASTRWLYDARTLARLLRSDGKDPAYEVRIYVVDMSDGYELEAYGPAQARGTDCP